MGFWLRVDNGLVVRVQGRLAGSVTGLGLPDVYNRV